MPVACQSRAVTEPQRDLESEARLRDCPFVAVIDFSAFQSPSPFGTAPFTQGGLYPPEIYYICHSEERSDEESVASAGLAVFRNALASPWGEVAFAAGK